MTFDIRQLLSDWLETKNHSGDHTAHSDRDLRGDNGQDTLGFSATGPTRRDQGGDPRGDHGECDAALITPMDCDVGLIVLCLCVVYVGGFTWFIRIIGERANFF